MRTKSGEDEDENTSIELKCFTWVETGKRPTAKAQKTSEEKITYSQNEEIFLFKKIRDLPSWEKTSFEWS